MLKLINPWVLVGLLASHGALAGWAAWAELRVRDARTALAEQQTQHQQAAREAAEQIVRLQDEAVARERQAAQDLADLSSRYHQEQLDAQARADADLTDLRNGNLKLRQRLAATHCGASVSGAATGTGGSDAAGETGLRTDDADFLVRLADRADTVTRRLTLCQATISQYHRLAGGASSTAPSPGTQP